jgi:3-hydroxyisobutyrate dehydrogenase-like beta-hydroxyacid dehydrogenase
MNIGFIGIGRMGRFMARNLAKGGHNLTVFDTHRDAAEESEPPSSHRGVTKRGCRTDCADIRRGCRRLL